MSIIVGGVLYNAEQVRVGDLLEEKHLGEGACLLKMLIPGLPPQTEGPGLGWAPSGSVFNMHPRWFSCKPVVKHYFKK